MKKVELQHNVSTLNYSMNYGVAAWEGIRAYYGKLLFGYPHYERLLSNIEELAVFKLPYVDRADNRNEYLNKLVRRTNNLLEAYRHYQPDIEHWYVRPIAYVPGGEKVPPNQGFDLVIDIHVMPINSILSGKSPYVTAGYMPTGDFRRGINHTKFLKSPPNYWKVDRAHKILGESVDEVLFNHKKHLVEGGVSTLFGVTTDGTIDTPFVDSNFLLPGITRKWIMDNFGVEEIGGFPIEPVDLIDHYDELFLVGTYMEVSSITKLKYRNGKKEKDFFVGNGTTPVADSIRDRYFQMIKELCGEHKPA